MFQVTSFMAVGDRLPCELQARHSGLAMPIGYARGYLAGVAADREHRLDKLWKRYTGIKPLAS